VNRRELITVLGGTAAAWPVAARAQRTGKIYRIGILLPNTPAISARNPRIQAFLNGLRELGWIEGQNLTMEYRWADGDLLRLPALAAELGAHDVVDDVRGLPRADVVIDVVGNDATIAAALGAVVPYGSFALVGAGGGTFPRPWTLRSSWSASSAPTP